MNNLVAVGEMRVARVRVRSGCFPTAAPTFGHHPLMADMQVIVGTRIEARCASITCMIRHYVCPKSEVIFDHPTNAGVSTRSWVGGTGLTQLVPRGDAGPCYRLSGSADSPTMRRNARTAASYSSGASRLTS